MSWNVFDNQGNAKTGSAVGYYAAASKSATYALTSADHIIFLLTTTAGAGFTVTLPAASTALTGKEYILIDREGNAHNKNVTLAVSSGDFLDDVLNDTYVLNVPREQVRVYCNGTRWYLG